MRTINFTLSTHNFFFVVIFPVPLSLNLVPCEFRGKFAAILLKKLLLFARIRLQCIMIDLNSFVILFIGKYYTVFSLLYKKKKKKHRIRLFHRNNV